MTQSHLGGVPRSENSPHLRVRAAVFLLLVAVASVWLAVESLLAGMVSSFATPSIGRRLLVWDANDPRLEDQLGQVFKDTDRDEGLRHLERATQLSPASRLYWSDRELACENAGDAQCTDQARERLLQLCPMAPGYYWLEADSYLRTNRLDLAFAQYHRLLELDLSYAGSVWSSLQDLHQPERVYERVLADNPRAELKLGYVDFLSDQGDNEAAFRIWRRLAAGSNSFPYSSAASYLDRLIAQSRINEAVNVWQDLERLAIVEPDSEKGNLMFNGEFERPPLNSGFDWRTGYTTYLAVDFSASPAYHGKHSLRIDFTVSRNDQYEPVYQIVPVLPRQTYRLEAYVRTQEITSDTGPGLLVRDITPGGFPDAASETSVGTTPWHLVRASFTTGPRTQAVQVSFWRPRSRVFPTEIVGTAWLDAVSLRPEDSPR
jgi:hypothetical protein